MRSGTSTISPRKTDVTTASTIFCAMFPPSKQNEHWTHFLSHPQPLQDEMYDSQEWTLLFQFDELLGQTCQLYFWLRREHLQLRQFEKVTCIMQST
jgi:uncharacterized protein YwqG